MDHNAALRTRCAPFATRIRCARAPRMYDAANAGEPGAPQPATQHASKRFIYAASPLRITLAEPFSLWSSTPLLLPFLSGSCDVTTFA